MCFDLPEETANFSRPRVMDYILLCPFIVVVVIFSVFYKCYMNKWILDFSK